MIASVARAYLFLIVLLYFVQNAETCAAAVIAIQPSNGAFPTQLLSILILTF